MMASVLDAAKARRLADTGCIDACNRFAERLNGHTHMVCVGV